MSPRRSPRERLTHKGALALGRLQTPSVLSWIQYRAADLPVPAQYRTALPDSAPSWEWWKMKIQASFETGKWTSTNQIQWTYKPNQKHMMINDWIIFSYINFSILQRQSKENETISGLSAPVFCFLQWPTRRLEAVQARHEIAHSLLLPLPHHLLFSGILPQTIELHLAIMANGYCWANSWRRELSLCTAITSSCGIVQKFLHLYALNLQPSV